MSDAKAVLKKLSLDHRLRQMTHAGRDPASPAALRHFGVTPDISEFIPIFREIRLRAGRTWRACMICRYIAKCEKPNRTLEVRIRQKKSINCGVTIGVVDFECPNFE